MNKKGLIISFAFIVSVGILVGLGYWSFQQMRGQRDYGTNIEENKDTLMFGTFKEYDDGTNQFLMSLNIRVSNGEENKIFSYSTDPEKRQMVKILGQNDNYRFIDFTKVLKENYLGEFSLSEWLQIESNSISVSIQSSTSDCDEFYSAYYRIEEGGLYFLNLPNDLGDVPEVIKGELLNYDIVN